MVPQRPQRMRAPAARAQCRAIESIDGDKIEERCRRAEYVMVLVIGFNQATMQIASLRSIPGTKVHFWQKRTAEKNAEWRPIALKQFFHAYCSITPKVKKAPPNVFPFYARYTGTP